MKYWKEHNWWLMSIVATMITIVACSDKDDEISGSTADSPSVCVQLALSMPDAIVGAPDSMTTRQGADVVQLDEDLAAFRGLDNVTFLAFKSVPDATMTPLAMISNLSAIVPSELNDVPETNYYVYNEVMLPEDTKQLLGYAKAIDRQANEALTTHADWHHYGSLLAQGLTTEEGRVLDDIRFDLRSINTNSESCAGSVVGQRLLQLLTTLAEAQCNAPAPDDRWSTSRGYISTLYNQFISLRTSSSLAVQAMLSQLYVSLSDINSLSSGYALAQHLRTLIANACATTPAADSKKLTLADDYQGYPADVNLPEGAARCVWDGKTFIDANQAYGKGLSVERTDNYVYPAALWYFANTPIVASDSVESGQYADETSWSRVITKLYEGAANKVTKSTRSVAMVNQLQYAVGRIDTRVKMKKGSFYDAAGKQVDVTKGFTLKGMLFGGQRQADYRFRPVVTAPAYTLYDTSLTGDYILRPGVTTGVNYTLGLETPSNVTTYMALELVNNGEDFLGADGTIPAGGTFYLVAELDPQSATNYKGGSLDCVFKQDYATKLMVTILNGYADLNGDGKPDRDDNGDGIPDVYLKDDNGLPTGVDTNNDGQPDDYDIDGDGLTDKIVTDPTGVPAWDTDGDGVGDLPIPTDSDGSYPDTPSGNEGLATATYGLPAISDFKYRELGLSVDLSWKKGIVFNPSF